MSGALPTRDLVAALRDALPASCVLRVWSDDGEPALYPEESAAVARAVAVRRLEFARGRGCAREALAALGVAAGPIPVGPEREPVWPSGVVGSITHCEGFVAAVVARAADLRAIGLDVETAAPVGEDVGARVVHASERRPELGDLGDTVLSEIEAEKASIMANEHSLVRLEAMARHTLARVLADQQNFAGAVDAFREAAHLYTTCGESFEAVKVRVGIGTCYVDLGKTREGVRMLRTALSEAKQAGHRRLQAFAWSNLGQAYYRQEDRERARGCFRESDALALYNNEKQADILFLNAYYEWRMAAESDNPTRERIAFGRLKALRSDLERRFPEVEAFDHYLEKGCRRA